MRAAKPGKLNSEINVTPLVDVVLVLLIIFMVIAPQLGPGPDVQPPVTERPPEAGDDGRQIMVAIDRGGRIFIDDDEIAGDQFARHLDAMSTTHANWKVVVKGDATLTYGDVRQAMLAIEAAGFRDVGLVAELRGANSPDI
jgi:biopolymer transport protein TolR